MIRRTLAFVFCMAGLMASPLYAADPQPFPDFTFKRVKVPTAGSGPRITVQVQPVVQAPVVKPNAPSAPQTTVSEYDWFWEVISPDIADSGPGRLQKAVVHLSKSGRAPGPRLQSVQEIAAQYGTQILMATIGTRVSPAFALAVMTTESSGIPGAVSSAGATGLMQLMPDTASRFGVSDITDPAQNIKGGVAYLDWLMEKFDSDPILVLAGYNAGENAVIKNKGVPPYAETRGYVPKVLAAWSVARGMCQTPPELISDGCAFVQQKVASDG
jgi:hypothetical protein